MKYVLSGSLGNIGRPLAKTLIAAGHNVTVISSHPKKGEEIVAIGGVAAIGSVEDIEFLSATFRGADAVFTLIPPVYETSDWKKHIHSIGKNYADAIGKAGFKKVVNLSSVGAHMPDGCGPVSGLYHAEQELDKLSEVDIKHLRPAYFYTNLFNSIGLIQHMGILGNNFGRETKFPMTHPDDIAATAASVLQALDFTGHSVLYIASDERTNLQITHTLGSAIGKPELPFVEFSDNDYLQGMLQAGMPEEIAKNYVEMGSAIRSGEMQSDYEKNRPELSKIKIRDFAKDFAVAYAAQAQAVPSA